jgi:hypothetical protein
MIGRASKATTELAFAVAAFPRDRPDALPARGHLSDDAARRLSGEGCDEVPDREANAGADRADDHHLEA